MEPANTEKELHDELVEYALKQKHLATFCRELSSIWSELWDEDEQAKRKQILTERFEEEICVFLEDVVIKEKDTKDNYIGRIENLLKEINDLQKNLEIAIPYDDVETLPLHNMAYHLNKKAEKYRVIKNERISALDVLLKHEKELCQKLDMVPSDMKYLEFPTKTELKQLENHIAAMEQEIKNRSLTLNKLALKIQDLYRELDIKPTLNFEKEIVATETHENFILSNDNMKCLKDLHSRLEQEVDDAKQTAQELVQKLNTVWDYLDEPEEHRKLFLGAHSGHSVPVINSLKEELNRCDAKKRENMSKIVGKMRLVLKEEWDRCLISKDERDKFRPYHIDCFTQDLSELHEFEIERLRNFYRNNEEIFSLIAKHQKLFNKLIELEKVSKNANRYYNRGGQLLQEERERKKITKELPIVEEELKNLLRKFEEDHGKPFTSFGVPMLFVLEEQWNAHFDQKTIDKLARTMGSEKKRKTPLRKRAITTPGSSVANKITKLNSEKVVSSTTKCGTSSVRPKVAITKYKKKCFEDETSEITLKPDFTYDEFQNELQAKTESARKTGRKIIRSTSLKDLLCTPRPVLRELREKNTPVVRSATNLTKASIGKLAFPATCSTSAKKTPKTIPRTNRRKNQDAQLTPAVNRLPLIL